MKILGKKSDPEGEKGGRSQREGSIAGRGNALDFEVWLASYRRRLDELREKLPLDPDSEEPGHE